MSKLSEFKLCFVKGDYAWFTTQDLSKQWGDDWDDAPYESNAGEPYNGAGRGWDTLSVFFTGAFSRPHSRLLNSPWSVKQINNGAVAWLYTDPPRGTPPINIFAGITLPRFIELVRQSGGEVYLTLEQWQELEQAAAGEGSHTQTERKTT